MWVGVFVNDAGFIVAGSKTVMSKKQYAGVPFLGGPPMPPGLGPHFRMHLANMQKSNWEMQQYRTHNGGTFGPGPSSGPCSPCPGATASPQRRARSSRMGMFGLIHPSQSPILDQIVHKSQLRSEQDRRAWRRLQESKVFFGTGGATPGTRKTWHYRRVLGFGGNGLAAHWRVHEDADRAHHDVAVKIQLRGWRSLDLKKEKMVMRKLSHAAHIVQEVPPEPIGKPARKNIPLEWREDDSSDEYDSSGDEDTPEYRPANRRRRKARRDFTPQKPAAKVRRWFGPPPTVNNDNGPPAVGEVSGDEKDFIMLEYLENGDLRNLIAKVRNVGAEFPNRVLWSFWLCLTKHLDEFIPPAEQKWRRKRMVHFDYDPCNIPKLKLADFGLADEVKEQKRDCYYVTRRQYNKFYYYAPEQFTDEWDFIPTERNGANIIEEPVAGNYGIHTNIRGAALSMWSLITLHYPPQPPLAGWLDLDADTSIVTYGNLLFNGQYDHVDRELRLMVNRCMAHSPLEHAEENCARVPAAPGEDDARVHHWLQNQVLSAQSLRQEVGDPARFLRSVT
ncbi:hypothetical protein DL762_003487 [Monosporascus cannonballus]|uniref:Protein kinase domain-containing protein n=1 Tax=Monosporascus cannonballus TaxID=155416 RepID=A0ABY0HEU2_9PEZI|nr:hypothetical protein DL762_003487 [Monosporascus cannonballus]